MSGSLTTVNSAYALFDPVAANIFLTDEAWCILHVNPHAAKALQAINFELHDRLELHSGALVGESLASLDEDPARLLAMLDSSEELPFRCDLEFGLVRISAIIDRVGLPGDDEVRIVTWADESDRDRRAAIFADFSGQAEAISRSQALAEFDLNGVVLSANEVYLDLFGYRLDEIVGSHHRLFVDADTRESAEYAAFWGRLSAGNFERGEYKRIAKDGSEVWLQSSYNPIFDPSGNAVKVLKCASDVTEQKKLFADFAGQIEAIDKSLAVIHFKMDGTILGANSLFLDVLGYSEGEIVGRHHSMFVDESARHSQEYADSWRRLAEGEFLSGEFKRIAKDGSEVWLQSSYNPILDLNGVPVKVVKYAFEVTEKVRAREQVAEVLDTVVANSRSLSAASAEFMLTSQRMRANSRATSDEAAIVASAAEQVSQSVTSTVRGIEALTASIGEISNNAAAGASVAQRAVEVARLTNDTISKLGQSSEEIANAVDVIRSIASRTDLLALNASIEAARAGAAGKGFAVVAGEVKTLASSTRKATLDITETVEAIQKNTAAAIVEIDNIGTVITQIDEMQSSIAAAVDEQSLTTTEMSRDIGEAARRSSEIADSITAVASIASVASEGARKSEDAAQDLGRIAADLEALTSHDPT